MAARALPVRRFDRPVGQSVKPNWPIDLARVTVTCRVGMEQNGRQQLALSNVRCAGDDVDANDGTANGGRTVWGEIAIESEPQGEAASGRVLVRLQAAWRKTNRRWIQCSGDDDAYDAWIVIVMCKTTVEPDRPTLETATMNSYEMSSVCLISLVFDLLCDIC